MHTTVSQRFSDYFQLESVGLPEEEELEDEVIVPIPQPKRPSLDDAAHMDKIERLVRIRPVSVECLPTHLGMNRSPEGYRYCDRLLRKLQEQGRVVVTDDPRVVYAPEKAPKPKQNLFKVASTHQRVETFVDPNLRGTWKASPARQEQIRTRKIRAEREQAKTAEVKAEKAKAKSILKKPAPKVNQSVSSDTREKVERAIAKLEAENKIFSIAYLCKLAGIWDGTLRQQRHKELYDWIREHPLYQAHASRKDAPPGERRQKQIDEIRSKIEGAIAKLEELGQPISLGIVARTAGIWEKSLNSKCCTDLKKKIIAHPLYKTQNGPKRGSAVARIEQAIARLEKGEYQAIRVLDVVAETGLAEHNFYTAMDEGLRERMRAAIARCKEQALSENK